MRCRVDHQSPRSGPGDKGFGSVQIPSMITEPERAPCNNGWFYEQLFSAQVPLVAENAGHVRGPPGKGHEGSFDDLLGR